MDIRDVPMGAIYYVVTGPDGRCVENAQKYRLAWETITQAKSAAKLLGKEFRVVKTVKA